MANNPPLTTDPIEFDPQTRRYRWTRPWWVFFDAFRRESDDVIVDEDIIDAFQEALKRPDVDDAANKDLLGTVAKIVRETIGFFPGQPSSNPSSISLLVERTETALLQGVLIGLSMQRDWSTFQIYTPTNVTTDR